MLLLSIFDSQRQTSRLSGFSSDICRFLKRSCAEYYSLHNEYREQHVLWLETRTNFNNDKLKNNLPNMYRNFRMYEVGASEFSFPSNENALDNSFLRVFEHVRVFSHIFSFILRQVTMDF